MIPFQAAANSSNLPLTYLAYSLLIIFICAAALAKSYLRWRQGRFTQGSRMIQGLLTLVFLRMAVFLITYLVWRQESAFTQPMVILDLAASLLGILVINWMWNFPEPSKEVDPVAAGVLALISVVVIGQLTLVPGLMDSFLGTELFWLVLSCIGLGIGAGLILIRKPNFWIYGLFMQVVLFIGVLFTILGRGREFIHLSQLSAYPLLLLIGDRFPGGDPKTEIFPEKKVPDERRLFSVELQMLDIIQRLFDDKDPTGILYKIARATAYLILADLALVIDTPDEHGKLRIIAGYDLIREEPLQAITLDSKSVPLLSNYIERGKMLHIPASSTSRDLSHLSKILQISKPGHLLASPVYVPGANKTIGVVLFSPFSDRPWTKKDQDYIKLLSKLYESAFSLHLVSQEGESESVKNTIRDLSSKLTQITQKNQELQDDMAVLSREHQNLLMDQDAFQDKYNQVMTWGGALQRHLAALVDLAEKQSTEALYKYISVIENDIEQIKDQPLAADELAADGSAEPGTGDKKDPDHDTARPADIEIAIQECLESTRTDLDEKEITTSLELPDNPPLLRMSQGLFQEIFSFLVSNAIEESQPGGEIKIRTQVYKEDSTQHFAHIKISDQGQGYHPEEIADILHNNLTTNQQDELSPTMTNLYLTKNLVENEGGRLWVESKPGEGTTVSLLLAFR